MSDTITMAADASKMQPSQLANVQKRNNSFIQIKWRPAENPKDPKCVFQIICEKFPKDVAVLHSNLAKAEFPTTKLRTTQLAQGPTTLLITGGKKDSMKKAFQSMLTNCSGNGYKVYPPAEVKPYTTAVDDLQASEMLGMTVRIPEVQKVMLYCLNKGLEKADVIELYKAGEYFKLRPVEGLTIPAHEIGVLLTNPNLPDEHFVGLSYYVADKTWADMGAAYNKDNKKAPAIAKATPTSGKTSNGNKHFLEESKQYLGIRREFIEFGTQVNYIIDKYQRERKAGKQAEGSVGHSGKGKVRENGVEATVATNANWLATWAEEHNAKKSNPAAAFWAQRKQG